MSIPLVVAKQAADSLCEQIKPYCEKLLMVGSIRRRKKNVKDIDLVIIPKPRGATDIVMWAKQQKDEIRLIKGKKAEINFVFRGIPVDIFLATEETWHTLVLIRTGPKESNIRLCTEAKRRGWKMRTAGEGLFNERGERIAGDSEKSFFEALEIPYQPPEFRK